MLFRSLEFLGRNDFQVKVRGFRIELGEIEARLQEHPQVREAVVLAREDEPGDKRLVAYYTASGIGEAEAGSAGAEQLRLHLSVVLPDYMVPAAYVRMESLPLTPSGKLDRKALPAPEQEAYAVRSYEEPVGEMETKLAEVWAEVLKLEKIGRHDNFFELGGHSLMAVRVATRLRESFKVDIPLRRMFEAPTIAQLAEVIDQAMQTAGVNGAPPHLLPAIKRVARKAALLPVERIKVSMESTPEVFHREAAMTSSTLNARESAASEVVFFPASFGQQRLWFIDQLTPGNNLREATATHKRVAPGPSLVKVPHN